MTVDLVGRTTRWLSGVLPTAHDVVVIQFALGSYRQAFVDALAASGEDVVILAGDEHFGRGVVTSVDSPIVRRTGSNVFLLGRRAGWQRRCIGSGVLARFAVVELNPRNLTTWLLLALRAVTGRPTGGWGHAHSRSGPAPRHNRLRRLMQRGCTELVAYTENEAEDLRTVLPGKRVVVAPNALYSVMQLSRFELRPVDQRRDLLVIGRLVPEKKVLLAVEAFATAVVDLPGETLLHIVGAGPQESGVRELVESAGLADRVRLHGWVSDPDLLAPVFGQCCALLSPGYVGLNVTQALGFGVPVLYARDEPHAPEFEALGPANSRVFDSDDVDACRRAVVEFYGQRTEFDADAISAAIRARYSTDRMIMPFLASTSRA